MNYAEFSAASEILSKRYSLDPLMMAGEAIGDNGTKYVLDSQKGTHRPNSEAGLLNKKSLIGDFVWKGPGVNKVTVAGHEGGGHPALTHGATIYCAGRIEDYGFFFHSGHYHPEVESAIPFLCDFIENSCAGTMGGPRDVIAERLTALTLRFYVRNSKTEKYYTTFTQLAINDGAYKEPVKVVAMPVATDHSMMRMHSSAMAIPTKGSQPIAIKTSAPTAYGMPIAHTTYAALPATSAPAPKTVVHKQSDLGITIPGQYLAGLRITPPRWMPDHTVTHCMNCKKEFTMFTRKHHCRKCGHIFCATCSDKTAIVPKPAVKDGETAVDGTASPVRVCVLCA